MRIHDSFIAVCTLAGLLGVCGHATAAHADIIYQDLGGLPITADYADVPLDMDLDGNPDVFARFYADCDIFPIHEYSDVFVGTAVDRAFIAAHANGFFARGLAPAEEVGPAMNFKPTADMMSGQDDACDGVYTYLTGDWLGQTTRYIGIKLVLPDGVHFGWARIENQTGQHTSFRVLDCALQTQPGLPILTGDMGDCPAIIAQPAASTVIADHSIRASVTNTGHATAYQWFKDGQPLADDGRITGATGRALEIRNATPADTAHYTVQVTGLCGTLESDEASVFVDPDCRPMPGSELLLDGATGFAKVPDGPDLHLTTAGTIEFWLHAAELNGVTTILSKGGSDWCANHSWSVEYDGAAIFPAPLCIAEFTFNSASGCKYAFLPIPAGEPRQWTHIAITLDTQAGYLRGYVNGQLKGQTTTTADGKPLTGLTVKQTPWPMGIGAATSGDAALTTPLAGRLDEVRVWNTARTAQQISLNYNGSVAGNSSGLAACYCFNNDFNPGQDATGHGNQSTLMPGADTRPTTVCCDADFDASGFADTDDFTAFVLAFESGASRADFDRSGFVDTDDFTAFVLAFDAGC